MILLQIAYEIYFNKREKKDFTLLLKNEENNNNNININNTTTQFLGHLIWIMTDSLHCKIQWHSTLSLCLVLIHTPVF